MRGRNQGQWRRLKATASPWFLVKGENLVVREVSSTKEITFYRSTEWTKDRPTPPILASSKRKKKKVGSQEEISGPDCNPECLEQVSRDNAMKTSKYMPTRAA